MATSIDMSSPTHNLVDNTSDQHQHDSSADHVHYHASAKHVPGRPVCDPGHHHYPAVHDYDAGAHDHDAGAHDHDDYAGTYNDHGGTHDDDARAHDDACSRRVRRRAVRGGLEHVRAVRRRQVLNRSGRHERRHMQQLRRRDILHRSGRRERGHLRAVCRRQVLHCGRVGVPLPGWHLRRGRERRVRPVRGGHLLPEVRHQRLIYW